MCIRDSVPHFTTLQKAAARLGAAMLHLAVGRFARTFCPGAVFAGIDATGFETRHAATYYTWRAGLRHEYTKLSACSDMGTQLVMAVKCGRGTEHDVSHIPVLLSRVRRLALPLRAVIMDKGYDAEWVHEAVRNIGTKAVIPVRQHRLGSCLLYTSPSPRDRTRSRMPSSA